ncbi:MAG: shikimate dehydrogenase [Atribacterota bacterium]|nr:shikimate dehydrogenase [Atribacterota bacterium]
MKSLISILGLIGEHIENSLSPFIHKSFISEHSLNYCYLPFQIKKENLVKAIIGAKSLGVKGLNITFPFKEKTILLLDEIDSDAENIGAINTILIKNNKICGYNTDWKGFTIPLIKRKIKLKNKNAIVLGAGGAARAVVYSLAKEECSAISIFNRNLEHALEIKKDFQGLFPSCKINIFSLDDGELKKIIKSSILLVNTTPLGSWYYLEQCPLPAEIDLPPEMFVYDLIYNPDKTPLVKMAEIKGNKTVNGKEMLVYQAAESFSIWTGLYPGQNTINQILDGIKD